MCAHVLLYTQAWMAQALLIYMMWVRVEWYITQELCSIYPSCDSSFKSSIISFIMLDSHSCSHIERKCMAHIERKCMVVFGCNKLVYKIVNKHGWYNLVTWLLLPKNWNCKQTLKALSHACTTLWENCTTKVAYVPYKIIVVGI